MPAQLALTRVSLWDFCEGWNEVVVRTAQPSIPPPLPKLGSKMNIPGSCSIGCTNSQKCVGNFGPLAFGKSTTLRPQSEVLNTFVGSRSAIRSRRHCLTSTVAKVENGTRRKMLLRTATSAIDKPDAAPDRSITTALTSSGTAGTLNLRGTPLPSRISFAGRVRWTSRDRWYCCW